MSFPNFPTLSVKPDSSKFGIETEDPAIRDEMEGGYVTSRPRHTRIPRKMWKVAYTYINNTDKDLIEAFVNTVRGGSAIFVWTSPQNNVQYNVRFKGTPQYIYRGAGATQRWDVSFQLEQA